MAGMRGEAEGGEQSSVLTLFDSAKRAENSNNINIHSSDQSFDYIWSQTSLILPFGDVYSNVSRQKSLVNWVIGEYLKHRASWASTTTTARDKK